MVILHRNLIVCLHPSCYPLNENSFDWLPNNCSPNNYLISIVPSGFLDDLVDGKECGYENYPAWFMDIAKDGVTIVKMDSGMDPLAALSKACEYSATTLQRRVWELTI